MAGTIGGNQRELSVVKPPGPIKIATYNILWLEENKMFGEMLSKNFIASQQSPLNSLCIVHAVHYFLVAVLYFHLELVDPFFLLVNSRAGAPEFFYFFIQLLLVSFKFFLFKLQFFVGF